MSTEKTGVILRLHYEKAARAYLRSLPPEHFMEATAQGRQREITLESLALVTARRPEVQVFNELLVQYPLPRRSRPGQVVPDNMIVVWKEPLKTGGSFDLPLQPTRPFCVLEYVSKHSERKDYDDNLSRYERELKVPYYLLFYPDEEELTLYCMKRSRYVSVPPNEEGRHPIPELELEVALLDSWVRYWYQGELLPLPGDLLRSLEEANQRADEANQRADKANQRADKANQRAEEERQARNAAEQELAQLRSQVEQLRRRPRNGS